MPKQGESETESMSVSLFQPLFLTLTFCCCVCWLVIEWRWEEKQPKKGSTHRLQKSIEISREQGQALMENEEKLFNQTPRRPIDHHKGRWWNKIQKFNCCRKRGEERNKSLNGFTDRAIEYFQVHYYNVVQISWFHFQFLTWLLVSENLYRLIKTNQKTDKTVKGRVALTVTLPKGFRSSEKACCATEVEQRTEEGGGRWEVGGGAAKTNEAAARMIEWEKK